MLLIRSLWNEMIAVEKRAAGSTAKKTENRKKATRSEESLAHRAYNAQHEKESGNYYSVCTPNVIKYEAPEQISIPNKIDITHCDHINCNGNPNNLSMQLHLYPAVISLFCCCPIVTLFMVDFSVIFVAVAFVCWFSVISLVLVYYSFLSHVPK